MSPAERVSTPLHTDIAIRVSHTPVGGVTMLCSEGFEHTLPLPPDIANGEVHSVRLEAGLGFLYTRFSGRETPFIGSLASPYTPLKFSFILSPGTTKVTLAGGQDTFRASGGQSIILSTPSETDNMIPPSCQIHNLCILVERELLRVYLRDSCASLPRALWHALQHDSEPYYHTCDITPAMYVVLEQILHCPLRAGLKRLYLQAKCMELIALRLAQYHDATIAPKYPALSHADIDCLHAARSILINSASEPPGLRELASMVGINSNKLKYGFRQVFGTTVFAFVRNLRLEQARQLLREGDYSVTEVALRVGYRSLSHFARVFRSTYGLCPHAYSKLQRPRD